MAAMASGGSPLPPSAGVRPPPRVVGIAGASGSGKSTLASLLHMHYGCRCADVIRLDAFYRQAEWVSGRFDPRWESPDALDYAACADAVKRAVCESGDAYVFVEGFLLFHEPSPLLPLLDTRILLEVSSRTALRRRHQRGLDGLDLPTLEVAWLSVIWPSYVSHTAHLRADTSIFRVNAEAPVRAVVDEAIALIDQADALTVGSLALASGRRTAAAARGGAGGGDVHANERVGARCARAALSSRRPAPPAHVAAATAALFHLLRAARDEPTAAAAPVTGQDGGGSGGGGCGVGTAAPAGAAGRASSGDGVDIEEVRARLEEGALVDMPAADGETLLRLAVWGGHARVARLLLEARAPVRQRTEWGGTALSVAADRGNTELAALLLEWRAEPNGRAPSGTTVLMFAAAAGHARMVRLLVDALADVHARDAGGHSALHLATPEAVQPLLRAGARLPLDTPPPLLADCPPPCARLGARVPCLRARARMRNATLEALGARLGWAVLHAFVLGSLCEYARRGEHAGVWRAGCFHVPIAPQWPGGLAENWRRAVGETRCGLAFVAYWTLVAAVSLLYCMLTFSNPGYVERPAARARVRMPASTNHPRCRDPASPNRALRAFARDDGGHGRVGGGGVFGDGDGTGGHGGVGRSGVFGDGDATRGCAPCAGVSWPVPSAANARDGTHACLEMAAGAAARRTAERAREGRGASGGGGGGGGATSAGSSARTSAPGGGRSPAQCATSGPDCALSAPDRAASGSPPLGHAHALGAQPPAWAQSGGLPHRTARRASTASVHDGGDDWDAELAGYELAGTGDTAAVAAAADAAAAHGSCHARSCTLLTRPAAHTTAMPSESSSPLLCPRGARRSPPAALLSSGNAPARHLTSSPSIGAAALDALAFGGFGSGAPVDCSRQLSGVTPGSGGGTGCAAVAAVAAGMATCTPSVVHHGGGNGGGVGDGAVAERDAASCGGARALRDAMASHWPHPPPLPLASAPARAPSSSDAAAAIAHATPPRAATLHGARSTRSARAGADGGGGGGGGDDARRCAPLLALTPRCTRETTGGSFASAMGDSYRSDGSSRASTDVLACGVASPVVAPSAGARASARHALASMRPPALTGRAAAQLLRHLDLDEPREQQQQQRSVDARRPGGCGAHSLSPAGTALAMRGCCCCSRGDTGGPYALGARAHTEGAIAYTRASCEQASPPLVSASLSEGVRGGGGGGGGGDGADRLRSPTLRDVAQITLVEPMASIASALTSTLARSVEAALGSAGGGGDGDESRHRARAQADGGGRADMEKDARWQWVDGEANGGTPQRPVARWLFADAGDDMPGAARTPAWAKSPSHLLPLPLHSAASERPAVGEGCCAGPRVLSVAAAVPARARGDSGPPIACATAIMSHGPIDAVEAAAPRGSDGAARCDGGAIDRPCDPLLYCREYAQMCKYCEQELPLRAKHCKTCNRCVRKMDHHCPWVANCVGERNHSLFWWYLVFELALCVWTFTFTVAEFTAGRASDNKQFLLPALIVCAPFSALIVGLLLTHSSFALFNRTTFETVSGGHLRYLKGRPAHSRSPFDRGMLFNLATFCCACARRAPVDWAELLAEEEQGDGWEGDLRPKRRSVADALGCGGALSPRDGTYADADAPADELREARKQRATPVAARARGPCILCAAQMELV